MNPTLVSISCLFFLAVYVSAKKNRYEVVGHVTTSDAQTVNGKLYMNINPCTLCKGVTVGLKKTSLHQESDADQIISGETYGANPVYLEASIEKVKGLSVYWESTDPNEEAKIKVDNVSLRQFWNETDQVFEKTKKCVSHTKTSLMGQCSPSTQD